MYLHRLHFNTGLLNAKSCVPVLGIVVIMISSKIFLHRLATPNELTSSEGLCTVFFRNKSVHHERLFKKIRNLLIAANIRSSYISSVINFLEKDRLDRNVRLVKTKLRKREPNLEYWESYLISIGYSSDGNTFSV